MKDEMMALGKNGTWDLVELPKYRKTVGCKWVFKLKRRVDDTKDMYKVRLVANSFSQKAGIDFHEIFSPVVKIVSIRIVLALVALLDLEFQQLDVKTAFLHGDLDEEIYMEQPEGFVQHRNEKFVCRLKKSLDGLKQSPRQWYKKFDFCLLSHKYVRSEYDHCVYFKQFKNGIFIILVLYVDDMLLTSKSIEEINRLKAHMARKFDMKDLGVARQILGMEIFRDKRNGKLWLSQQKYIEKILLRFAGVVSRYMENLGKEHWSTVKWVLRYLRGTSSYCITYNKSSEFVCGYVDSDFAGDLDKRRSTLGLQDNIKLFCHSQSAIHLAKNPAYHSKSKHIPIKYHFLRQVITERGVSLEKVHTKENCADMFTKQVLLEKLRWCLASLGLRKR
eukprot:PITA_22944